jgi:D-alanyl-D-alanine carboxypeptidase
VLSLLRLARTRLPSGYLLLGPSIHGYDVEPPQPPEDVTTVLGTSGLWAAGAIYSTPVETNRFFRAYVGGRLFGRGARRQQLRFVDGKSQPTGPGRNSAGLALFRYRTRCRTVYGHTGNTLGYTQFAATSSDGRRSAVVSINAQITPRGGDRRFPHLREAYLRAVCAALAQR